MEKEVTKAEYEVWYEKYAVPCGYDLKHWKEESSKQSDVRYFVTEPASPRHTRVFIITGGGMERMVFMTEEGEEQFFDHPSR